MAKNCIEYGRVEADALQSAVGQVLSRALDDARVLESTGRAASEVIGEVSRRDFGENLEERAIWLHGLASHAMAVVSRLQFLAGRLSGLADGRTVIEEAAAEQE